MRSMSAVADVEAPESLTGSALSRRRSSVLIARCSPNPVFTGDEFVSLSWSEFSGGGGAGRFGGSSECDKCHLEFWALFGSELLKELDRVSRVK